MHLGGAGGTARRSWRYGAGGENEDGDVHPNAAVMNMTCQVCGQVI